MEKILVTGGCGFIGSNFIRMLLRETGIEVVNFDLLTYAGNPNNLKGIAQNPGWKKRYKFVKGDIADPKTVSMALDGVDTVFNFAAESHVDNSIRDASAFVRTNVQGTKNMVECAMKAGVQRLLQVGTDEVYGSVEKGSSKETDRLEPRNPYSATKAASDLIAMSYCTTFGFDVVVTRSSNNYGPYQYPEKVIPLFVTNLIEGKKVPLYGDGKNVRDWLHVDDNCRGILLAGQKGKKGGIYNIGGGNEVRNIELTRKIISLMGKGEEMILPVEDRKGHDLRYSLDSTKMHSLGWKAQKKFDDGLKETVQWYRDNEAWWKPLKEART
ncbi:GDP-L-fucose synthase [uncultured archaeon]|nr:GDP-L-fucose synthase [uncultured archaeon]